MPAQGAPFAPRAPAQRHQGGAMPQEGALVTSRLEPEELFHQAVAGQEKAPRQDSSGALARPCPPTLAWEGTRPHLGLRTSCRAKPSPATQNTDSGLVPDLSPQQPPELLLGSSPSPSSSSHLPCPPGSPWASQPPAPPLSPPLGL